MNAIRKTVLSAVQPTNSMHIGNYLGAGEQSEVGPVLKVAEQHAKAALVPAAVFERHYHPLAGQRVHGVARQLDIHADRYVVSHHREVNRIAHVAEVVERLGLVGSCVVGCSQHQRLRAQGLGLTSVGDAVVGGGIHHAHQHWHAPCRLLDRSFNHQPALGRIEEHAFAGGTQHEQAVHTAVDDVAQHRAQTPGVNLSVMVVGRGNRGNNAVELER